MDYALARRILKRCRTLDDAELKLAELDPLPSRAFRWGLFDGHAGRPKSLAGIIAAKASAVTTEESRRRMAREYSEGHLLGESLFKDTLPA